MLRLYEAYRRDMPPDLLLKGSGYRYDGSAILSNRQRNIDAALADFGAS
ncbi:hypothetical protein [Paracoccus sediminicola]|nr:hypothetical protein [Paracoccus sediminicola]WBU56694.1 hypothetical protein PAF18_14670 [Paracoccus sediminicola]